MRVWTGILLGILFAMDAFGQAKPSKSFEVNSHIAVFYPGNFDSLANMPSFALEKEPVVIGKLTQNRTLVPEFYTKAGKSIATIPVKKGTSLYGTGEVTGPLLRNGKTITLWNTDSYGYYKDGGRRLYQSHPWVLGINADGSAFGVLADNTWKEELILNDSIHFISEGKPFRIFIIHGISPQEVLKSFSDLTGKMPLPPLWSLGYQQCRFSYVPDSRIKEIADTFRLKKIPCDVIWVDIDYMERFKVFTFDKKLMNDPADVNRYLHVKGFKSIWMIDPGVKAEKDYGVYESGTVKNLWVTDKYGKTFKGNVWPGACVFPDFTQPATQMWWEGLYRDYMSKGMDGVWNDMNEPSVFDTPDGTMPEDNIHLGGGVLPAGPHLRYHNVYGMLMIKSTREGILKVNPTLRPFVLSRSGFLGCQRYGATWTGDNIATMDYLKMSVPMSLNLGLSGQPFSGSDIGGYSGNVSATVYAQWIALGALYPFSRGHSDKLSNNKEPWAFGNDIEDIARTAIYRRYRLLPYLYTLFRESSLTGLPVMRPVFFADASDTSLRKEDQAFLLGDNLLVVPKWSVRPSLPKGRWTTVSIAGEKSNDPYQPEIKIKSGTIVPLGRFIQNTCDYRSDSLTLLVALDAHGKALGSLYEDAGNGFGYLKGDFLQSAIIATKKGSHIHVTFLSEKGNRKIINRKWKVVVISDDSL